jgi:hypothetical protein
LKSVRSDACTILIEICTKSTKNFNEANPYRNEKLYGTFYLKYFLRPTERTGQLFVFPSLRLVPARLHFRMIHKTQHQATANNKNKQQQQTTTTNNNDNNQIDDTNSVGTPTTPTTLHLVLVNGLSAVISRSDSKMDDNSNSNAITFSHHDKRQQQNSSDNNNHCTSEDSTQADDSMVNMRVDDCLEEIVEFDEDDDQDDEDKIHDQIIEYIMNDDDDDSPLEESLYFYSRAGESKEKCATSSGYDTIDASLSDIQDLTESRPGNVEHSDGNDDSNDDIGIDVDSGSLCNVSVRGSFSGMAEGRNANTLNNDVRTRPIARREKSVQFFPRGEHVLVSVQPSLLMYPNHPVDTIQQRNKQHRGLKVSLTSVSQEDVPPTPFSRADQVPSETSILLFSGQQQAHQVVDKLESIQLLLEQLQLQQRRRRRYQNTNGHTVNDDNRQKMLVTKTIR